MVFFEVTTLRSRAVAKRLIFKISLNMPESSVSFTPINYFLYNTTTCLNLVLLKQLYHVLMRYSDHSTLPL